MNRVAWLSCLAGGAFFANYIDAYEIFRGPTELIHHDPTAAFEGYTLFGAISGEAVYLINSVYEIDPYDGPREEGRYTWEHIAGHTLGRQGHGSMGSPPENVSNQIVWSFSPTLANSFFSSYISGAQRLPNGNTLVCSGAQGHLFEVTANGDVVWEYVNPVGRARAGGGGMGRVAPWLRAV